MHHMVNNEHNRNHAGDGPVELWACIPGGSLWMLCLQILHAIPLKLGGCLSLAFLRLSSLGANLLPSLIASQGRDAASVSNVTSVSKVIRLGKKAETRAADS